MKYVIIGASAAGISGVKRIREIDPNAEIILISKDEYIYSRCILHHYISGKRTLDQLNFVSPNFIEEYNINWLKGEEVIKVDSDQKFVVTNSNKKISFDKLLIASGSHVNIPQSLKILKAATNVVGLHNLDDCEKIMYLAKYANNIVIIGAGLIGIDAISGLLNLEDKNLTIIERCSHLLPLQLDTESSSTYENAFAQRGVKQYYNAIIKKIGITKSKHIIEIILSNGELLNCDLLIIASGVRPNVAFLEGSGIEVDYFGLVIDEYGQTSCKDIYGAGDVSGRRPIWSVAVKEGIIAGSNMAGVRKHMTDFFASKSTMNFFDIPTLSLGNTLLGSDEYEIEVEKDQDGNYKKIIHKDGKIYGAILQGDLSYSGVLTQLIALKIDVSRIKKSLFKINYADFFHQTKDFEFDYEEET
ncbi:nitrate reductase [Candidatus Epulonipiscium fishelsonii]|uniref:Nitrate reductase n=1 Tax=Candidatus Epulonipiscium fishelsonii TaxID=77094 RepID=A0ACC8XC86_9FIRM|nr:nitrate reductase [Epulopiscium sp. SCG-B11WGA-EpuloA1]ONI42223.1 nitrate reductase [Epulopiscium sp. SCG-B05WGA-EpuloA1]